MSAMLFLRAAVCSPSLVSFDWTDSLRDWLISFRDANSEVRLETELDRVIFSVALCSSKFFSLFAADVTCFCFSSTLSLAALSSALIFFRLSSEEAKAWE